MPRKRRVRAADVAREAGVSAATVSYVLNNTPGQTISEPTAKRVREAAKRLGYVRNTAAQTLARGKSGFVIVDASDFATQESAALFTDPLIKILRTFKYEPFMTWWPKENGPQERSERLLSLARVTNPEIVITVTPLDQELKDSLEGLGVESVVSVVATPYALTPALELPTKTQVDYLANQGHTHILFAGTNDAQLSPAVQIREDAGKHHAQKRGITWTPLPRHSDAYDLSQELKRALETYPDATAIAAYNDVDALTALFACHLAGINVPSEVAVIGVDNEKYGELSHPALTTVSYTFELDESQYDAFHQYIQQTGTLGILNDPTKVIVPHVIKRDSA